MKVLIHVSTMVPFSTLSLYNDTDFREEVSKLIVCSFHNSNCNYFKKDLSLVVYIYIPLFLSLVYLLYVSLMVTTKQKPILNTKKIKKGT